MVLVPLKLYVGAMYQRDPGNYPVHGMKGLKGKRRSADTKRRQNEGRTKERAAMEKKTGK